MRGVPFRFAEKKGAPIVRVSLSAPAERKSDPSVWKPLFSRPLLNCRGSGIFSVARLACLGLYRLDKHPLMSKGKGGFVLLSRRTTGAAADLASLAFRGS